jgi:hypothetical protein
MYICTVLFPLEFLAQFCVFQSQHFRKFSSKSFLFIKDFFYGENMGVISLLIPSRWEGDGAVGGNDFCSENGIKNIFKMEGREELL